MQSRQPRSRPRAMQGVTERVRTGHGNMYVTINFDDAGNPFEVFANLGKAGGCDAGMLEAISRLASLALRSGIDAAEVVNHLRGITCCPLWDDGVQVGSAPDALALALSRHCGAAPTDDDTIADPLTWGPTTSRHMAGIFGSPQETTAPTLNFRHQCPECSSPAVYAEGCARCSDPACGWSKCD